MRGPADVVQNVLQTVSPTYAASISKNPNADASLPCTSAHELAFQIGGKMFPVDPRDFISATNANSAKNCVADTLVSTDPPGIGALFSWSLGDPFFKSCVHRLFFLASLVTRSLLILAHSSRFIMVTSRTPLWIPLESGFFRRYHQMQASCCKQPLMPPRQVGEAWNVRVTLIIQSCQIHVSYVIASCSATLEAAPTASAATASAVTISPLSASSVPSSVPSSTSTKPSNHQASGGSTTYACMGNLGYVWFITIAFILFF